MLEYGGAGTACQVEPPSCPRPEQGAERLIMAETGDFAESMLLNGVLNDVGAAFRRLSSEGQCRDATEKLVQARLRIACECSPLRSRRSAVHSPRPTTCGANRRTEVAVSGARGRRFKSSRPNQSRPHEARDLVPPRDASLARRLRRRRSPRSRSRPRRPRLCRRGPRRRARPSRRRSPARVARWRKSRRCRRTRLRASTGR